MLQSNNHWATSVTWACRDHCTWRLETLTEMIARARLQ